MKIEERLRSHFQREDATPLRSRDSIKASIQSRLEARRNDRRRIITVAFSLAVSAFVFVWALGLWSSRPAPRPTGGPGDGGVASVAILHDLGGGGRTIVAGGGAVWVGTDGALTRVDPLTNEHDAIVGHDGPGAAIFSASSLWVSGLGGQALGMLVRFDETGSQQALVDVGGGNVSALAGDDQAIWAIASDDVGRNLSLLQIDPASNQIVNELGLDSGLAEGADYRIVRDMSVGGGKVWLLVSDLRVNSRTKEMVVVSTELLSAVPGADHVDVDADLPGASNILYSASAVWASRGTSNGLRVDPSNGAVETLSTSLVAPFVDADGNVLFARQNGNSVWHLVALDPATESLSVIATIPSEFADSGSLVGGTWDSVSSSAWLINEIGDVLKISP